MAQIGGFRSDLSITRKTDGNFGNVSVGVSFESHVSTKTVVTLSHQLFLRIIIGVQIHTP